MTIHLVYYFRKNFYLVNEINEKIGIMQSSGLINRIIKKYADDRFLRRKLPEDGPSQSQLRVQHFEGTFLIWIFGVTISIVTFCCEKLLKCLK